MQRSSWSTETPAPYIYGKAENRHTPYNRGRREYTTCEAGKRRSVNHTNARLAHKHTCFRYSCLGDLSLLSQLLSAIPIASTASMVLVRAGLQNLCTAEILLGIAGLDTTARSRATTSSTSRWPNVYVLYIPVVVPVFIK